MVHCVSQLSTTCKHDWHQEGSINKFPLKLTRLHQRAFTKNNIISLQKLYIIGNRTGKHFLQTWTIPLRRSTEGSSRAVLFIRSDLTWTAQINNAKTHKTFQEFKSENTFEKINKEAMTVHKTLHKPRSHNCVMSLRLRLPTSRSHNCADQPRYREGFLGRSGRTSQ